jgi:hypothetical protein
MLAQVPPPSFWSHLFLESPWPAIGGLIGAWAVLRVIGARRQQGLKLRIAAVTALGLAAALAVLAWAVTTDREQVQARTEALVEATQPLDRGTLDQLIQPDAAITVEGGPRLTTYAALGPALDRLEVASQSLSELEAGVATADEAVSRVALSTRLAEPAMPRPAPSEWRFHWRRDDQGRWRVREVVLVEVNGKSVPDNLLGRLKRWLP